MNRKQIELLKCGHTGVMLKVYRKHYFNKLSEGVYRVMEYNGELDQVCKAAKKEFSLSGDDEHRLNVVKSMVDRFARSFITVDIQLTVQEVDALLDLLRLDGGPSNSVEQNLILKFAFAIDAFMLP